MSSSGASDKPSKSSKSSSSEGAAFAGFGCAFAAGVGAGLGAGAGVSVASDVLRKSSSASPNNVSAIVSLMSTIEVASEIARIVWV